MSKKVKKFIFPGTTLIISFYLSILFTTGIIAGYLGTTLFHKKFVKTGRIKLLVLNFGSWKFHLHHWVIGVLIFLITYIGGFLFSVSTFWIGFVGGLIFHDVYSDKKWYRVLYRKQNPASK